LVIIMEEVENIDSRENSTTKIEEVNNEEWSYWAHRARRSSEFDSNHIDTWCLNVWMFECLNVWMLEWLLLTFMEANTIVSFRVY
jgi:hypothetical protein